MKQKIAKIIRYFAALKQMLNKREIIAFERLIRDFEMKWFK